MPKITNKSQFIAYAALVAVILIVLNIVARALFFRIDLTDRNMYSLSNSSREVIQRLDDRLVVKAFFSSDIPGTYASQRRYLQDILGEYEAYSNGRFHFEFVSPDKDEELQREAESYNIPPVQMQAVENDKMEVRNVYMGLVMLYQGKKETIPVIQSTQGIEYNLTACIKKIAAANLKGVGVISEENEEISTQGLHQFLEQIYAVKAVSLSQPVPLDIQVLMMNGVVDSLKTEETYNLDQFLMRGGRLFIAQGRVKDMWQQGFAMDIRSNVFAFLEHYGITIGQDLITDPKCTSIQVQSQQGPFLVRNALEYPLFPMIEKFNEKHPITKDLAVARVFFVSELMPSPRPGLYLEPLLFTSEKTGVIQGPFYRISPMENPMMRMFPYSTKVIGGLVEGTASSFFRDSIGYRDRPGFVSSTGSVSIVAITDNQFFNDKRAAGLSENAAFILNVVDYLSGEPELIAIRAKDVTMRPLSDLSNSARQMVKWLNMVLPPLILVIAGLVKWRVNRNRRKKLEQIYG